MQFSHYSVKVLVVGLPIALLGCGSMAEEGTYDVDQEEQIGIAEEALCTGTSCNKLDPNVTGCDVGANTLATRTFAQGKLELRSSSKCPGTKWAKVTRNDGNRLSGAWVQTSTGVGMNDTTDWVVWSYMWSNMWYAPSTPMKACATITSCTGSCDATGTTYCTSYY